MLSLEERVRAFRNLIGNDFKWSNSFLISCALGFIALLLSRLRPDMSFLYFLGISGAILSFCQSLRKQVDERLIIIQLIILSTLTRLVDLVRRGLPWDVTQYGLPSGDVRFAYAISYVIGSGRIPSFFPLWERQPYMDFPGSIIISTGLGLVTNARIDFIYQYMPLLQGITTILFFYLFVKEVSGDIRLAGLSSILMGLFRATIGMSTKDFAQGMSILMWFITLFLLAKASKTSNTRSTFILLSLLTSSIATISHHEATYIFLIAIVAIWTYQKLFRSNSIRISLWPLLFYVGFTFSWVVYVATGFFKDLSLHAFFEYLAMLREGIKMPWLTWPIQTSGHMFFTGFESIGTYSSYIFYILGLTSVGYILIVKRLRYRFGFVTAWAGVFSLSFVVSGFTQFGNIIDAPRQLTYLAFPFALGISVLILHGFVDQKVRLTKSPRLLLRSSLIILILLVVFIQSITAFPLYYYGLGPIKEDLGPNTYTAHDKFMSVFTRQFTEPSVLFLADDAVSNILLFYGQRRSTWTEQYFVQTIFGSEDHQLATNLLLSSFPIQNIATGEYTYQKINYVVIDVYNYKYGFYDDYGGPKPVAEKSLILQFDNQTYLNRVFDDTKNIIYSVEASGS